MVRAKGHAMVVLGQIDAPRARASSHTILVVEDDAELRRLLVEHLAAEGFAVSAVADGAALDRELGRSLPDLLILDIMLPGEDGLSICRRLRQRHALPILMLTARGEEVDRVLGLEFGADDYVTKPFSARELAARIRAILRRGSHLAGGGSRIAFSGWTLDLGGRSLCGPDGTVLDLTTGEFDVLACLATRPFRVLSRDQIMDLTRADPAAAFDRAIDIVVSRLRRKLTEAGAPAQLIKTVRSSGYMFAVPVREA
jgi:two-component system OmpR family response regulator